MMIVNSRKHNVQFVMTLDNCSMLKDQKREEKRNILWTKKLWNGCYLPVSQEHNAKTPKERKACMICKHSHPTVLHRYLPKKRQPNLTSDHKVDVPPAEDKKLMTSNFTEMDIKWNSSSIESKVISMCMVPVNGSHSKSNKEVSTYAMLGNFIKVDMEQLTEKLILQSRLLMENRV